jgi:hypothetical protein
VRRFPLASLRGSYVLVLWIRKSGAHAAEVTPKELSPSSHSARLFPQPAGNLDWVYAGLFPPGALVA